MYLCKVFFNYIYKKIGFIINIIVFIIYKMEFLILYKNYLL